MAEIKITKCKSCGASITWIKTKNGRVLRVMVFKNPSPSGLQPIINGKGYISHFATCPYANKYRRRDND